MDQRGSSPSETFGGWKSQRRFHRKITKATGHLGSSQGSIAESVFDPAAEGEGKMTETGRFAARPWTPADDEVLRSLALNGVDARGIGNRLNRTAHAVRSRAKRLNILIRKHQGSAEDKEAMGKRSTWTSKDDDQLRALAASGENSPAIAVRLNRTAAGVRKRAMALGIKLAGSKRELGLKVKGK
jgi:hypothetical protein